MQRENPITYAELLTPLQVLFVLEKEGRYTGTPPKGYKRERNIGGKSIIIPDENAIFIKETFEIVALGLYPIDNIRKTLSEKGLKIGRSAFYSLLRNKTYMGFTKVPQFMKKKNITFLVCMKLCKRRSI